MKVSRLLIPIAALTLLTMLGAVAQIPKGSVAPDFTLNDLSGNAVSLSGLRGRVVLLEFFGVG